jgi:hypothetical protein
MAAATIAPSRIDVAPLVRRWIRLVLAGFLVLDGAPAGALQIIELSGTKRPEERDQP